MGGEQGLTSSVSRKIVSADQDRTGAAKKHISVLAFAGTYETDRRWNIQIDPSRRRSRSDLRLSLAAVLLAHLDHVLFIFAVILHLVLRALKCDPVRFPPVPGARLATGPLRDVGGIDLALCPRKVWQRKRVSR